MDIWFVSLRLFMANIFVLYSYTNYKYWRSIYQIAIKNIQASLAICALLDFNQNSDHFQTQSKRNRLMMTTEWINYTKTGISYKDLFSPSASQQIRLYEFLTLLPSVCDLRCFWLFQDKYTRFRVDWTHNGWISTEFESTCALVEHANKVTISPAFSGELYSDISPNRI